MLFLIFAFRENPRLRYGIEVQAVSSETYKFQVNNAKETICVIVNEAREVSSSSEHKKR